MKRVWLFLFVISGNLLLTGCELEQFLKKAESGGGAGAPESPGRDSEEYKRMYVTGYYLPDDNRHTNCSIEGVPVVFNYSRLLHLSGADGLDLGSPCKPTRLKVTPDKIVSFFWGNELEMDGKRYKRVYTDEVGILDSRYLVDCGNSHQGVGVQEIHGIDSRVQYLFSYAEDGITRYELATRDSLDTNRFVGKTIELILDPHGDPRIPAKLTIGDVRISSVYCWY